MTYKEKVCTVCGCSFKAHPNAKRCNECGGRNKPPPKRVKRECVDCGASFTAPPSHRYQKRCKKCSEVRAKKLDRERMLRFWAEKHKRENGNLPKKHRRITCPDCNKEFVAHYATKRCEPCSKAHINKVQRGSYKKWREVTPCRDYLNIKCADCGKEFFGFHKKVRCEDCQKERRRSYDRKRAKAGKEKKRKYDRKYRLKNKAELKLRQSKAYFKRKLESPERHREIAKLNSIRYCKRMKAAVLPSTDMDKVDAIYIRCLRKRERTGKKYEVDHKIPLVLGGAHHQDNLRIVLESTNRAKGGKFIASIGGVWADNDLDKKNRKLFSQNAERV